MGYSGIDRPSLVSALLEPLFLAAISLPYKVSGMQSMFPRASKRFDGKIRFVEARWFGLDLSPQKKARATQKRPLSREFRASLAGSKSELRSWAPIRGIGRWARSRAFSLRDSRANGRIEAKVLQIDVTGAGGRGEMGNGSGVHSCREA